MVNLWLMVNSYHLVMTNSSPWYRWPIEIGGLPINSMGGSFHGELLNNQMAPALTGNGKFIPPTYQNGDFPIKNGDFPIKNCDVLSKW
jgi:hypothetical protein